MGGFLSFLGGNAGNLLSGLFGGLGGASMMNYLNKGVKAMGNLPGMKGPSNLSGNFGSSVNGNYMMDPTLANAQLGLSQGVGLLGGGMANDPSLQAALGSNDIAGAMDQSNAALMAQMTGNSQLGGFFDQASGLGSQIAQGLIGGPQDYFGGRAEGLMSEGMNNIGSFADTQSSELAAFRAAAQPEMQRQQNQLFERAQAMGMGLPSTGNMIREQQNAFNQQDLDFQTRAFDRAVQRSQLGGQQVGLGSQLTAQNLGQYNQNLSNFGALGTMASGLENTMFNQQLQALGFNSQQGMNRVNQAMGLLGGANDIFAQNFGLGLGASEGLLGMGNFGLQAAAMPYQLQAQLLQGSGEHGKGMASMYSNMAQGSGGLFGGIGRTLGKIFSDRRLKKNLRFVGHDGLGNKWYEWDWNSQAKLVGAHKQPSWGVIAQEVQEHHPEAVTEGPGGFLQVDYEVLYHG